mmetsp:Transcript_12405/g.34829  ORF Transcript_12405/g.34829 Transcript_12405/m.34829 type:complete len:365 (-) Transcript_12405:2127-3221(-)
MQHINRALQLYPIVAVRSCAWSWIAETSFRPACHLPVLRAVADPAGRTAGVAAPALAPGVSVDVDPVLGTGDRLPFPGSTFVFVPLPAPPSRPVPELVSDCPIDFFWSGKCDAAWMPVDSLAILEVPGDGDERRCEAGGLTAAPEPLDRTVASVLARRAKVLASGVGLESMDLDVDAVAIRRRPMLWLGGRVGVLGPCWKRPLVFPSAFPFGEGVPSSSLMRSMSSFGKPISASSASRALSSFSHSWVSLMAVPFMLMVASTPIMRTFVRFIWSCIDRATSATYLSLSFERFFMAVLIRSSFSTSSGSWMIAFSFGSSMQNSARTVGMRSHCSSRQGSMKCSLTNAAENRFSALWQNSRKIRRL